MLGIRRRAAPSRAQLAKEELNESFDHLVQAATHMAGGAGATMGPRVGQARDLMSPATGRMRDTASHGWEATMAALAPLAAAARDGAREAGKTAKTNAKNVRVRRKKESRMSRNRWPMLAVLLATGAAVGAAGALIIRRRNREQWEEYGPSRTLDSAAETTRDAVDRAADSVSSGAGTAAAKVSSTAKSTADKTSQAAQKTADKTDEMVGRAGSPSKPNPS
ncbi:MAG TPA: hypothetical protein VFR67_03490 [Pilimelia sp.]|nr:hypothetical protein [Pilimelia sp.]